MSYTQEERELILQAGAIATRVLTQLKAEREEITARIAWHEANAERARVLSGIAPAPVSAPQSAVKRARRGSAEANIMMILEDSGNLNWKMSEMQKEAEARFGERYGASTIYRVLDVARERAKEKTANPA